MFSNQNELTDYKGTNGYSPEDIATICYRFAYMVLPPMFFGDPAQLIKRLQQKHGPMTGAHSLFVSFCLRHGGINPKYEEVESMRLEEHDLDDGCVAQIIVFPEPRPINMEHGNIALAPYLMAFVYKPPGCQEPRCFVVGQKPYSFGPDDHTATVRWISADGSSGRDGQVREPTVERFVAFLNARN